ncbi:hypothetical protein TNCV_4223641 [Trichonephila clavipes]|nr:hypothetical protein TNCV_4223641 [Trichonephila clavipes]
MPIEAITEFKDLARALHFQVQFLANGCHQSQLGAMKSFLSGNHVVYIDANNSRKETISFVVMDIEIGTLYL